MSIPELESATAASRKPTTVCLRAKGGITIPRPIRAELGLEIEDQLIVTVEDGRIILTPAAVVPRTGGAWAMKPKPASEQIPYPTGTRTDAELEDADRDAHYASAPEDQES